jgi:hypothetical protein
MSVITKPRLEATVTGNSARAEMRKYLADIAWETKGLVRR